VSDGGTVAPGAGWTFVEVGAGLCLVGERTVALFEPLNAALADRLWALISASASADELLEAVSVGGLRQLGSFALAHVDEDRLHIVVRHEAVADLAVAEGSIRVEAGGARTWVERVVDDPLTPFSLRLTHDDAPLTSPFRVRTGLVPAVAVRRGADVPVAELVVAASAPFVQASAVLLAGHDEEPAAPVQVAPETASDIVSNPPPIDEARTAPPVDDARTAPPIEEAQPEAEQSAVVPSPGADPQATLWVRPDTSESPPDAVVPAEPTPSAFPPPPSSYDDIFGATVARSVQQAAVAHEESSEGLISAIPTEIEAPLQLGDHDGRTITKAQLMALRGAGAGAATVAPTATGGQIVQAVVCPSNHPNPPSTAQCRVCGAPLSSAVVNVVRPPLGVLRFSTGREVRLDRSLLVGRNPKVSGMVGGELPEVVTITEGSGLSRTHLAIRLESWQILAEDLNSANGTIVTLPGQPPRRLHPGEPCVLEPGAHVDLGGEVSFRLDMG
jgi:hypothetical protein